MFAVGYRYCNGFDRACTIVEMLGRLRPDVTREAAQRELDVIARRLEATYPQTNKGMGVLVVAARGQGRGSEGSEARQIGLFVIAVGVVLLIGCANIAGLLLTRAVRRRKEVAVRLALGASRSRLVRQLLTESIVLALIGGSGGLLLSIWGNDVLGSLYARDSAVRPIDFHLALGGWVVAATMGVTLLCALLFGLVPSLQASRPDVISTLKYEGASGGAERARLRQVLLVGQIALSVVLLVGAGLLVRSLQRLYAGPGFDPASVIMLRLRPSLVDYPTEKARAYQREVLRRLESLPGVVSAAPSQLPAGLTGNRGVVRLPAQAETEAHLEVPASLVGPRFFETLSVPLIEGREFTERDTNGAPAVLIINDILARRLFAEGRAAGEVITYNGRPHEIVGVVGDTLFRPSGEPAQPVLFLSYWQAGSAEAFAKDSRTHVRVAGDAHAMMAAIRREVAAVDPNVPMHENYPFSDLVAYMFQPVRMARTMLVAFGGLALFLTSIGLYGVLAFTVSQRTREIGIRVALGAERRDVAGLVMREGIRMTLAGAALGLAGAWLSTRVLGNLLYGIDAHDLTAFIVAPAVLVLVALAASYFPARRAARVSPLTALRHQ